jgi:hypothetical protein
MVGSLVDGGIARSRWWDRSLDGGQVRFDAQRRNELTHPTSNLNY